MEKIYYTLLISFCFIFRSYSQDTTNIIINDSTDFSNLSIEELMKLKSTYQSSDMEKLINQSIEVASRKPLSLKKSPSVISVITADEIEKSGSNDIIDVLNMIPGIQFNMDVQGSVGISMRGLWAQEGKVLVLFDGQEMNDVAYGCPQFSQQYPINQIKKIEVIRGPGSASFGGFAEYAVINIITKNGEDLKGGSIHSTIGQTSNTYTRQNLDFSLGNKKNDFTYSLSGFVNRGQRSNLDYSDIYGTTYNMTNNSNLNAFNINLGVSYKGLSFRFVQTNLYTTMRDQFEKALSKAYKHNFFTSNFELKYQKQLSKTFQLQAKVNYKNETPWNIVHQMDSIDDGYLYRVNTERIRGNIGGIWDINRFLNLTFGIEGFHDKAQKIDPIPFAKDSSFRVTYFNYAPYLQSLIKTRFANITIGVRHDNNSAFGSAINPRFGITKKIGSFNTKALFASSFRAPSIENYQSAVNSTILPEKSQTIEFEIGYQLNKSSYFSINAFDITTKNTIHYLIFDDPITNMSVEGYNNLTNKIGSQGVEIEYRLKSKIGSISTSYSYYTIANKNVDDVSATPSKTSNLGIANHKFNFVGTLNLGKSFFFTTSASIMGKRFGYTSLDSLGNGVLSTYNPQLLLNSYLNFKTSNNRLNIGFGIRNITNQRVVFIQPYNSLHGTLPGIGREYNIKITYLIHSKK
jgi:outer membrane receptor for ferrienterochelin and colicin